MSAQRSVKPRLTVKRAIETPEYAGMVRRMIRAYGKRVADADEVDLATMLTMRDEIESAIATAVTGQRERGASWADVARGLGTTRQAAQIRYGKAAS
jgi:hypothetical protein